MLRDYLFRDWDDWDHPRRGKLAVPAAVGVGVLLGLWISRTVLPGQCGAVVAAVTAGATVLLVGIVLVEID